MNSLSLDALFQPADDELTPPATLPGPTRLSFAPDVDSFVLPPGPEPQLPIPPSATEQGRRVLAGVLARYTTSLGRAARADLGAMLSRSVEAILARHADSETPASLQRRFDAIVPGRASTLLRSIGEVRLARELRDERRRDAVESSDLHLPQFLSLWRRRLQGLQLAFPRLWHVEGLTTEELVDELQVRLLEAIRRKSKRSIESFAAIGQEATFRFLARQKDALRKRRHMFVVPDEFGASLLQCRAKSPEELLRIAEGDQLADQLIRRVAQHLTPLQRQWYFHFLQDFREHGTLNLARCAAARGKNRSSAFRGIEMLRTRLVELGAAELVDDLTGAIGAGGGAM